MSDIMHNSDLEVELSKLNPVTLDSIAGVTLMNRIEIKYAFSIRKLVELVALMGEHYHVLEICNMRMLPYSTTYLDTDCYLFYNQHVRGEYDRHKLRYRKYEATGESFLEIKKKTNKGRTIKWRMASHPLQGTFDSQAQEFLRDHLPVCSTLVRPALLNQFTRISLAGIDLKERVTIDFNISFTRPETMEVVTLPFLAIAELKQEAYSDSAFFKRLIRQLCIYPAGFSKYCIGSALLNDSLKKNMIKPKLLLLNKLKNECT